MKKKPKISIITCTYNRLEQVKKNLESVKRQNYFDYEHFILDDGSSDGTKDYFLKIKDDTIKYLRFDENLGQPSVIFNSNVFQKVSGDYVVLHDSDDYLFDGAFDSFAEYYSISGDDVWTFSFDFSDNHQNFINLESRENTKKIVVNSKDCFNDSHPRNNNKLGYRDSLTFRKKIFYDKIKEYFVSPDNFYSAPYEVTINNTFKEMFVYKKIYFMNFGSDSVTRGFNIQKYRKHTLISREILFNKYQHLMGEFFFSYTLKSLVMNYLVNKEYKKKIFNLIFCNIVFFKKNVNFLLFVLFSILIPAKLLLFFKAKIKHLKSARY